MQILLDLSVDGILRNIWASLCQLIYKLVAFLYELFMNVAKVKLLTQDDIKPIYQRITLILAIVMVFYVSFEVVKYIISPDTITDKEKGASGVVKRMIIVVVLIAMVPTMFEKAYEVNKIQACHPTVEHLPPIYLACSIISMMIFGPKIN